MAAMAAMAATARLGGEERAGMSKSHLDRIERTEVALDRISEIVALADALQIAPSELIRLPIPAPADGDTDSAIEAVRSATTAASRAEWCSQRRYSETG
jgi:transcriptional regulator with XRE-family HTH domain